jgi:type IV fimbrial biogenesis protein FimT
MRNRYQGFSLIELLVVLMIIGVIASIGMPSFNSAIRSSNLTTMINELITDLNVAKSEAIKRNQNVVVRKNGANWENGWQIFVDTSSPLNNSLDGLGDDVACQAGNDCLLRIHDPLPSIYTLRYKGFNSDDFIRYKSNGVINNNNGTFYLCDNSDGNNLPDSYTAKTVVINVLGRARVGIDTDGNGIPEKDNGNEITTCIP